VKALAFETSQTAVFVYKVMVKAYYFDNPTKVVSLERLRRLGVLYWKVDADRYKEEGLLERICQERHYRNRDEVREEEKTVEWWRLCGGGRFRVAAKGYPEKYADNCQRP
jgi:hypothetical protein